MNEPLAIKMRPESLNDVIGQKHLVGENKVLFNMVKHKRIFSMILYGNPGIGKTTIALAIVKELNLEYKLLNATVNNKKDFDEAVKEAKEKNGLIILMDEIHRLNKDKQDLLLPYLESGLITLIGMTTANPYHSINTAIRSRCQIFELKPLTKDDILEGINKVLIKNPEFLIEEAAKNYIATLSNGDLRFAYNFLEVAYACSKDIITIETLKTINDKPSIVIDKNDDGYYDTISALQKSIRGSDVNAALHYLAKLIVADDLDIILRRLSVIAYEDIGLANPSIGPKMNAVINITERLGFPEARIPLAEIVIEMCLSPKSNSAHLALDEAINDVKTIDTGKVPAHLRTTSKDYKYPHDYKNAFVKQQYLPDKLLGKKYYIPKETSKNEQTLKQIYETLLKLNS
jgi:putative ATPase